MKKKKSPKHRPAFQPQHLKDDRKREISTKEFSLLHRIPTVGTTPVEYRIPPMLLHLFRNIETMADSALSEIRADKFNESYFDQFIDSIGLLADNHLKNQRFLHQRTILSIEQELQASLLENQNYLKILQDTYNENEEEIKRYDEKNNENELQKSKKNGK